MVGAELVMFGMSRQQFVPEVVPQPNDTNDGGRSGQQVPVLQPDGCT
jgi:hypothetical protein